MIHIFLNWVINIFNRHFYCLLVLFIHYLSRILNIFNYLLGICSSLKCLLINLILNRLSSIMLIKSFDLTFYDLLLNFLNFIIKNLNKFFHKLLDFSLTNFFIWTRCHINKIFILDLFLFFPLLNRFSQNSLLLNWNIFPSHIYSIYMANTLIVKRQFLRQLIYVIIKYLNLFCNSCKNIFHSLK